MKTGAWTGLAGGACLGIAIACGGGEPAPPIEQSIGGLAEAPAQENRAPRIERLRIEPAEPMPGDRLRAIATVRDPDGDRTTLAFRWVLAGRELPESGAEVELREVGKGAPIEVWATASDGRAQSEPVRATAEVANRRPVLQNVALQPVGSVLPGQDATALPIASDPDGDPLEFRFRWTVNEAPIPDQDAASLPTAGLAPGDRIRVQVVASDGDGESDAAWSGVLLVGNAAPEIVSTPSGVAAGEPFRYVVEARDPEGDRSLRYQLRKGPDGMTINPVLGEVRWQPRPDQAGVHPVEIAVEDSAGARAVQVFELTVGQGSTPPPAAPAD